MKGNPKTMAVGGLAGWLLDRLRGARPRPRLELLERIALAPRQSLALIEAEGRRFLVATSPEGAPAFYPLDGEPQPVRGSNPGASVGQARQFPPAFARPTSDRSAPTARVSW
jgi:flagellar biogenesis protein FliO